MTAPFECRLCRASAPEPVVDLGDLPLANAFVDPASGEAPDGPRFPVALVMCAACRLLQLREPAVAVEIALPVLLLDAGAIALRVTRDGVDDAGRDDVVV